MSEKVIYIAPSVIELDTAMGETIMEPNVPRTANDGDKWLNTSDGWVYEFENGAWHRRSKTTGEAGFKIDIGAI